MGLTSSKPASSKDQEAAIGRIQKFQFQENFWPEPIRKEGTTHSSAEHPELEEGVVEYVGTSQVDGHTFDTMVAAADVSNAPSARLFLYGTSRFAATGDERSAAVISVTIDEDSKAKGMVRYNDYFSVDADGLVDSAATLSDSHKSVVTLKAELTSAPDHPNDDERKVRMKKAVNDFVAAWKDSPDSSLKARMSKLPWKRVCAGDGLEKVIETYCTEACTFSMPLQQIDMAAKDLPDAWRARLGGKGPFVPFGQTEVFISSEGYAGHHPIGFAQLVVYSSDETTGQHLASNGVMVVEFNNDGTKMEKMIVFRDFVSEAERNKVIKKDVASGTA